MMPKKTFVTALAALCLLVATGCPDNPTPDNKDNSSAGGSRERTPARTVSLRSGAAAEQALSAARRELLANLRRRSAAPVSFISDAASGSILWMSLDYAPVSVAARDRQASAVAFLRDFQPLLDPRVLAGEYTVSTDAIGCNNSSVVFDRTVEGATVLGSQLAVHFSSEGRIVGIENSVASVARRVERPGGRISKGLERLLPRGFNLRDRQAGEVLIPLLPERGEGYLQWARHYVWRDAADSSRLMTAIDTGLGYFVGPIQIGGRLPGVGQPKYHADPQTGVPDFITYRPVGGAKVATLPGERNPAGVVYRFLKERPALFRTGSPRCQFRPASISESPGLPGVHFVRMEQQYAGLPVFGASLVFEVQDLQTVMSVSGHTLSAPNLDITPAFDAREAAERAKGRLREAAGTLEAGSPEARALGAEIERGALSVTLGVFPGEIVPAPEPLPTRLAYKVITSGHVYYIDAEDGRELYAYSTRPTQAALAPFLINDAAGQGYHQRPTYVLVNNNGVDVSPPGFPTNADVAGAAADITALRAFYAALGRWGVNGNGSPFVANTAVSLPVIDGVSSGCPNAFFDWNVTHEAYFCLGRATTDVIGHEFTHGVLRYSTGLAYRDEPGALHESYADIMGNLAFPDAFPTPPAAPGWLVGEAGTGGPSRDMAQPIVGNMAAYRGRNSPGANCTLLPESCDSGFVHINNGITNRAHVLLSDGVRGRTAGIGRLRLATLAYLTMMRFGEWSRLIDSALLTQATCDSLRDRGGLATDGATGYGYPQCDQVPIAFRQVGLAPDLVHGWSEPELGFSGTDQLFTNGETTTSGCNVTGVFADVETPRGQETASFIPGTGGAPPTTVSVNYLGQFGVSIATTPAPGGSPALRHDVNWFSIWGLKPEYGPRFSDAGNGASCITPVGFEQVERVSPATMSHSPLDLAGVLGNKGDESAGPAASSMDARCEITDVQVELLDGDGNRIAGPGREVKHDQEIGRTPITDRPILRERGASIIPGQTLPTRPPNLSVRVHWWHEDKTNVRYRLRYFINQPNGVTCIP